MPTTYWLKFGNTPLGYNGNALKTEYSPLRPASFRFEFPAGYTPAACPESGAPSWEWAQVSATPNVWDLFSSIGFSGWAGMRKGSSTLDDALSRATRLVEADCTGCSLVAPYDTESYYGFFRYLNITSAGPIRNVRGNLYGLFEHCTALESIDSIAGSGITNTGYMFSHCSALKEAPLFDTSNTTRMHRMFAYCTALEEVPLLNTANAVTVYQMFVYCTGVKSGALALYNQMASQATPPEGHTQCFYNCGSGTTTGAAELAQIPSDWK